MKLKTTFSILIFIFLFCQNLNSQSFVDEGNQWSLVSYAFNGNAYNSTYRIEGDTLINGIVHKKMWHTNEDPSIGNWTLEKIIREDSTQKVFQHIGIIDDLLIYDFGLSVGDTIFSNINPDEMAIVGAIDSIELNDFSNYMFTTNNENCFKLDQDDRRYLMVKAPNKPLEKAFYDEFYTFINDKSNMNKVYNYFMNYENNSFNVGTGRAPITQYKQEIMYENFPAHIEMLYKKPYLFYGSLMTSTELFDRYKEYAKQNYRTQSLTITKFGLDMKKYLEPFVKRSNGTKYNLIGVSLVKFQEHLYSIDKEYYKYINNIDDEPVFNEEAHKEDETEPNPLDY